MSYNRCNYTCMETCKQPNPCGNKYCSAHPAYKPPKVKNMKKVLRRQFNALHPKKKAPPLY